MINPAEDFAYISDENHALTPDERRDIARCIEDQGAGIVTLLIENADLRRQIAEAQKILKDIQRDLLDRADIEQVVPLSNGVWRRLCDNIDAATAAPQDPQSKPEQ